MRGRGDVAATAGDCDDDDDDENHDGDGKGAEHNGDDNGDDSKWQRRRSSKQTHAHIQNHRSSSMSSLSSSSSRMHVHKFIASCMLIRYVLHILHRYTQMLHAYSYGWCVTIVRECVPNSSVSVYILHSPSIFLSPSIAHFHTLNFTHVSQQYAIITIHSEKPHTHKHNTFTQILCKRAHITCIFLCV